MDERRPVRLAVAGAAGLAASGAVPVAWAVLDMYGAAVATLLAGAAAGLMAGTFRGALVAVVVGMLPAVWIDLFMVPTPPRTLGGFAQAILAMSIALLTLLGLVGAPIGVAAERSRHLDLARSPRRRLLLYLAAVAVGAAWIWFGVAVVSTASV